MPRYRKLLAPVALVGLIYLLILALYPILHGYTSPTDFIHIGWYYCHCAAKGPSGYDGQFYYYMAVDPLHASVHMDNAPYRYQRILFSMAVWALSLGGRPELVAWWLLILNVVGALAGTTALALLLERRGLSPWFSLAFGLYFGQLASITHDVPDGLAAGFVVFAALAADRERWKEAALWLAIASLTRETTLIFAAAAALDALVLRRWGRAALMLAAGVPLLLWLLTLRLLFGQTGLFFSGVVSGAPKIPFAGARSIASASPRFIITLVVIILPALLALAWAVREVLRKTWRSSPGLLFAVLISVGLVIFLNSFTYSDLASSTRVTIGLSLCWLLYAAARQSRPLLRLASPWALGAGFYAFAVVMSLQSIII
jgi:hypothetical protein